jgi:hypothetical protein
VSIQDERELRDRLSGLLNGLDPSPAPVARVVRHGKRIRTRRWVSAAAGVAVIALGGAALSIRLTQPHVIVPAVRPHYKITVQPPGKHAPAGLIATGSINGNRWGAELSGSFNGPTVNFGGNINLFTVGGVTVSRTDPANLAGGGDGHSYFGYAGPVSRSARYLTITLANRDVLRLIPVRWHGGSYVAVKLPQRLGITRLVAYERDGIVAYAIPFRSSSGFAVMGRWLRPGQVGLARRTVTIGSGIASGQRWQAIASAGPWGVCVGTGTSPTANWTTFCDTLPQDLRHAVQPGLFGNGPTTIGLAQPDVSVVRIVMSDRTVHRIGVVHIDGYGYFAMANSKHPTMVSWTAFNAEGVKIASGSGKAWGSPAATVSS